MFEKLNFALEGNCRWSINMQTKYKYFSLFVDKNIGRITKNPPKPFIKDNFDFCKRK